MGYLTSFWSEEDGLIVRKRRAILPDGLSSSDSHANKYLRSLPREVWLVVDSFLEPLDSVSLAVTCSLLLRLLGNKQGFDPEPSILPEVSSALEMVLPKQMDGNSLTMFGPRQPETYKNPQDPRTVGFCEYAAELAAMACFSLVIHNVKFDPERNTADARCQSQKCYDFILHFIYLSRALHARGHCIIGNVFWVGERTKDFGVVEMRSNACFVWTWSEIRNGYGNHYFGRSVPGWIPFSPFVHKAYLTSDIHRQVFLHRFRHHFLSRRSSGLMGWGVNTRGLLTRSSLKSNLGEDYKTIEIVEERAAQGAQLSDFECTFPAAAWRASEEGRRICDQELRVDDSIFFVETWSNPESLLRFVIVAHAAMMLALFHDGDLVASQICGRNAYGYLVHFYYSDPNKFDENSRVEYFFGADGNDEPEAKSSPLIADVTSTMPATDENEEASTLRLVSEMCKRCFKN